MNNHMNNYYQNNETEIDLIGLCVYVLKQWRKLLVLFIIGALIGCGVSFYKMNEMAPENTESYLAGLKADEINKENIRMYADYKALYDAAIEHGDESVILNLDENNVWTAETTYFITCDYDEIDEIVAYYNGIRDREGNLEKILKVSGLDGTTNDIRDLVSIDSWKVGLDTHQIISGDSPVKARNAYLSCSVTAPDEECLNRMINQIDAIVSNANKVASNQFKDITIAKIGENSSFGYSAGVAASKSEYLTNRQMLLQSMSAIKLSDDEKLYYAYHYNWDEYLEKYEGGFSKKWPAIMAVVFAFIAAGWYAVKFIFDKSIKSEDEIERIFGLQVLGSVDNACYKNVFDKLFDKWGKAGLAPANTVEYLRTVVDSCDADSVAIVYDADDAEEIELAESLTENSSKIKIGGVLASDAAAVEAVKSCDKTVLLAHMNHTVKSTFAKLLEANMRLEKDTVGVIVVR